MQLLGVDKITSCLLKISDNVLDPSRYHFCMFFFLMQRYVYPCVTLLLSLAPLQDTLGGRFDASQALVGELSLFNLWDRVLSLTEVAALAACAESPRLGNIVPWTDRDVDVFGGAVKDPMDPCLQRSHPRQ